MSIHLCRPGIFGLSVLAGIGCQPVFLDVEGSSSSDTAWDSGDGDWVPVRLYINEFMALNTTVVFDEAAEGEEPSTPDWIEIYNDSDRAIDLEGFALGDELGEEADSILSDVRIEAHGYVVLIADGSPESGPNHLGFKLDGDGESIGLYSPQGDPLDLIRYTQMLPDIAVARIPDGGELTSTETPTPGSANTAESME